VVALTTGASTDSGMTRADVWALACARCAVTTTRHESGAIVLHIAERSEALTPSDANARARTSA